MDALLPTSTSSSFLCVHPPNSTPQARQQDEPAFSPGTQGCSQRSGSWESSPLAPSHPSVSNSLPTFLSLSSPPSQLTPFHNYCTTVYLFIILLRLQASQGKGNERLEPSTKARSQQL